MKTLRKYKYSRLALLLWTALAVAAGYALASIKHSAPWTNPLNSAHKKDASMPVPPVEPQPNQNPDKRIPIGPTDI
jgi:hypothetical protein